MFNLKNLITNRDYCNHLRREAETLRTAYQDQASRVTELTMVNKDLETKLALCDVEIASMREMITEDEKKISELEDDLEHKKTSIKNYIVSWDQSLGKQAELENTLIIKCFQLKHARISVGILLLLAVVQSLRILHVFNF